MKALFAIAIALSPCFGITMTVDGSIPSLYQVIGLSLDGNSTNYYAGQIGVRFDDGSPALLFCADPLVWLRNDAVAVTMVPASGLSFGPRLAWMYSTYAAGVSQGWEAAALQLAAWDVVLDNGGGFSSGRLQARPDTDAQVLARATSILGASVGQTGGGVTFFVPEQGPVYSQTLFGLSPMAYVFAVTETPEPSTYWLLGGGLLALGAWRRRRAQS